MLILSRRANESIRIGSHTRVVILGVRGSQVRVGIEASPEIVVDREEVYLRKQAASRVRDRGGNVDAAEEIPAPKGSPLTHSESQPTEEAGL